MFNGNKPNGEEENIFGVREFELCDELKILGCLINYFVCLRVEILFENV
jgi:hypothetical protein